MKKFALVALSVGLLAGCGSTNTLTATTATAPTELSAASVSSKLVANALAANKLYFQFADRNQDGRMTHEEGTTLGWNAEIVKKLDTNGDGAVTLDELNAFSRPEEQAKGWIKMAGNYVKGLDRDGDAKLSRDEYLSEGRFHITVDKIVANPDPNILQTEFNKFAGKDAKLTKSEMALLLGDVIAQGYTYWASLGSTL